MILSSEQADHVKQAFSQMRSKQDLLNLLNYAKTIVYGEKAVPFELKHLNYHSNPKANKKRYKQFSVKKKSGDDRIIYAPAKGLKAIQRCLNLLLQTVFTPNSAATGFVPGKSILDNAQIHSGNFYVYNIDLKDFFHSVDQARIWKCFQLKPFNLVDEEKPTLQLGEGFQPGSGTWLTTRERVHFSIQKGGTLKILRREKGVLSIDDEPLVFNSKEKQSLLNKIRMQLALEEFFKSSRRDLAAILASLCCTEIEVERKISDSVWEKQRRSVLPQGAPTSPVVTNIVCQRLDFLLSGVAKRFGLRYSRYADDITFSSLHNVYQKDGEFLKELHRIIREQNFEIKDSKTRLQKDGYRQEVTGLVVNAAPNVPVRYIKQLRMWLYYWETYGYEKANDYFTAHYLADKGHIFKGKPNMTNVIRGKLDFLKMVKGEKNNLYIKLNGRFVLLVNMSEAVSSSIGLSLRDSVSIPFLQKSNTVQKQNHEFDSYIKDGGNSVLHKVPPKNIYGQNRIELTLRVLGGMSSLPLTIEKNIPKGTILPYAEVFENGYDNSKKSITNIVKLPKRHNPQLLTDTLKVFSDKNNPLKYSTHSWEYERFESHEQFLKEVSHEWKSIKITLEELNNRLSAKISNYLFNDKLGKIKEGRKYPEAWGTHKLKFGWSSPQLSNYLEEIQRDPFSFPIPNEIKNIESLNLNYFKDYVDIFKNEIEIREEGNQLEKIFNDLWSSDLTYDFKLRMDNLKGISFFTDVQWLKESLKIIFRSYRQRPAFNEIRVSLKRRSLNNSFELHLTQVGSICNRSIEDEKISNVTSGDFSTLFTNLQNLCDWSICAEFADGSYQQINFLSSNPDVPKNIAIPFSDGFTHILTFYL